MNSRHAETVSKVFIQLLEDVAMMFGDQAKLCDVPSPPDQSVCAVIGFSGAGTGTLRLITSQGAATELAANYLGLEIDDPEAQEGALDALKELLNVLLGHLLTEIGGKKAVFYLAPPIADEDVAASAWHECLAQEGTLGFVADSHPMLVRFDPQGEIFSKGSVG